MDAKTTNQAAIDPLEQIEKLVAQARRGDLSAAGELKRVLDANPAVWKRVGDLTQHVQGMWIDLIAQGDLLVRESIRRKLRRLRRELCDKSATPLQKLLIERILACWLQTTHAEILVAAVESGPLKQRQFYSKRLDSCERRYATAMAQLLKAQELQGRVKQTAKPPEKPPKNKKRGLEARKAPKKTKSKSFRIVSA